MFVSNPKARKYFSLVTPETILYRWKKAIKDYWTYDKPKTRKSGEIKPNYSWSKFFKSHWQSLFACDFFSVDIFGFKRFYVFFIIELKSRKIVHYNVTQNPNIRFLRSQLSHFEELYPYDVRGCESRLSYLIHDNSGELKYFPYQEYEIKGVAMN